VKKDGRKDRPSAEIERRVRTRVRPERVIGTVSLRSVARRSKLSSGYLSRVLSGQRRLSLDAAARLAAGLGITVDELYKRLKRRR